MNPETLKTIFTDNIAPALAIGDDQVKLSNGMSEAVAKKHREFSKKSEEDKRTAVLNGDV